MRPEPETGVSAGANSVTYHNFKKQMGAARATLSKKIFSVAFNFQVSLN